MTEELKIANKSSPEFRSFLEFNIRFIVKDEHDGKEVLFD